MPRTVAGILAEFTARCRQARTEAERSNRVVAVSWSVPAGEVPVDPNDLLVRNRRVFHWRSAWSGTALVALGSVADFTGQGAARFAAVDTAWRRSRAAVAHSLPDGDSVLVGGFAFRPGRRPVHHRFPDALMWTPAAVWRCAVAEPGRWTFNAMVRPADDPAQVAARTLGHLAGRGDHVPAPRGGSRLRVRESPPKTNWLGLVDRALRDIAAGVLTKVVMARSVVIDTSTPFDPVVVLEQLRARHRQGAVCSPCAAARPGSSEPARNVW